MCESVPAKNAAKKYAGQGMITVFGLYRKTRMEQVEKT
jgi:hypothetical protein